MVTGAIQLASLGMIRIGMTTVADRISGAALILIATRALAEVAMLRTNGGL
ncbi:MAG: hypothetical protein N838_30535 [Thiohalocapsa sp. PB-PSB1]|nr:MAG: hypothetical protein N838_30535 [Thiohalocapsa sp. PB-PSB1]